MSKQASPPDATSRQSRKQVLLNRKQQQQSQQIRLTVALVVGFILLILALGLIIEYVILPPRPVASVNLEQISLSDWQDRVRYERAVRIDRLESAYEQLGGNSQQLQQFFAQDFQLLLSPPAMGNAVLQQMINEALIRQAAAERGITVSDADVQQEIEAQFNYFGGGLPTPSATPTQTPVPTPSITPLPTATEAGVTPAPTTTPAPTLPPQPTTVAPTATPVSQEAFNEQFQELIETLASADVDEAMYRDIVYNGLLLEQFREVLADEQGVSDSEEQVSLFFLSFDSEVAAAEALAQVQATGYLTTWNTIRSTTPTTATATLAREIQWAPRQTLEDSFGTAFTEAAFSLEIDTPSEVISSEASSGLVRYYLINLRGREVRPLPEATLRAQQDEALAAWLDEQNLAGGVEIFSLWESRVPSRPIFPPYLLRVDATPTPPLLLPTPTP